MNHTGPDRTERELTEALAALAANAAVGSYSPWSSPSSSPDPHRACPKK